MNRLTSALTYWTCILGFFVGIVATGGCKSANEDAPVKASGAAPAPKPAEVVLATARDGGLAVSQRFLGRCEAAEAATIAPGVSGTVLSVIGHEGDHVKAGEVIVTLDETLIAPRIDVANAEVRRINAERRLAKSELDRAKKLAPPVVTEAELERIASRVSVLDAQQGAARANLATLEAERSRHRIVAPFDAVVRIRHVDPGTWVNAGAPLLDLVGVGTAEVFVDVPPELATRLKVGDRLTVLSDPPVEAEVKGVVAALDATTRAATVRLQPVEARAWLMPGRTVEVEFHINDEAADAVVVSRDALKRGPVSTRVYLVEEGPDGPATPPFKVNLVDVTVIATGDDEALVRGIGLRAGSRLVAEGNERLRPGQMVTVTPRAAPKADGEGP